MHWLTIFLSARPNKSVITMKASGIFRVYLFLLIMMFIQLIGCTIPNDSDLIDDKAGRFSAASEIVTTPTFPESRTSTLIAEISPTPTEITVARTPTSLPVPTLSEEEMNENLRQLLTTNRGCLYPCWWGIGIKGATVEDIDTLASITGKTPALFTDRNGVTHYSSNFVLPLSNFSQLTVTYFVENNDVISSAVFWPNPIGNWNGYEDALQRFLIINVLVEYGMPDEVLFAVQPSVEPGDTPWFTLWIIYAEPDFSIRYEGAVTDETPPRVCINDLQETRLDSIHLYMGEYGAQKDLETYYGIEDLKPIDEITNLTVDEFFSRFSSTNSDRCIDYSDE